MALSYFFGSWYDDLFCRFLIFDQPITYFGPFSQLATDSLEHFHRAWEKVSDLVVLDFRKLLACLLLSLKNDGS
jgi:hypothetical protein